MEHPSTLSRPADPGNLVKGLMHQEDPKGEVSMGMIKVL